MHGVPDNEKNTVQIKEYLRMIWSVCEAIDHNFLAYNSCPTGNQCNRHMLQQQVVHNAFALRRIKRINWHKVTVCGVLTTYCTLLFG